MMAPRGDVVFISMALAVVFGLAFATLRIVPARLATVDRVFPSAGGAA